MPKIRFSVSIGYVGYQREKIVEIDDMELEGLTEEERDKVINEYWQDWAWNMISGGWEELEDV